ncbi:short chain dehydrogenase [Klenkia soli]|uniref:Short chain dehydrogenase n=1 Tax=Klenkia soli TaxID=1052260 RepID=A0A1H0UCK5_9ACTN|nr:SDR family NAD(P)-dependent oxidoreductase [Klenkia soli]SDP63904.1 short chain dehydrogenase [Klenkia soli]
MDIDRSHVVVVGAGPGLGAGIARRFAREGFDLTLVARTAGTLDPLAGELRGAGAQVRTVTADVADPATLATALAPVAAAAPGVVVHNVGLVVGDDLLVDPPEHFAHALAVDVVGAVAVAQLFTPAMRAAGEGTFLVTGGGPALHPDRAHASLTLGKAALRNAVALLHEQLAEDGVHAAGVTVVGVVEPGTALDPDRIAEAYWELHAQPRGSWTADTVVDGS